MRLTTCPPLSLWKYTHVPIWPLDSTEQGNKVAGVTMIWKASSSCHSSSAVSPPSVVYRAGWLFLVTRVTLATIYIERKALILGIANLCTMQSKKLKPSRLLCSRPQYYYKPLIRNALHFFLLGVKILQSPVENGLPK